jgi:hypothetical protein
MNNQIAIMVILLAMGGVLSQVQVIHVRKPFLTAGQFRLVSLLGFFSFLGGVFVAAKSIFSTF